MRTAWLCVPPEQPESKALEALRACGRRGRWKNALELLARLESSGEPLPAAAIQWKVRADGKIFHSGLPHKGINAFELCNEAVSELQRRFYADFPAHPSEKLYEVRVRQPCEAVAGRSRRSQFMIRLVVDVDNQSHYELRTVSNQI